MQTTYHVRASSMPLSLKCPGSVQPGDLRINETNEAANVGTAVHAAMQQLIEKGEIETPVSQIAAAHGADPDETQVLVYMMKRMIEKVQEWSGGHVGTEKELRATEADRLTITGHADWLFTFRDDPKHLCIFDLKTGRLDSDYYDQMAAYAWLALKTTGQFFSRVTVVLGWLREGEIESYAFDYMDAMKWAEQAAHRITNWSGTYEPGTHCEHCTRRHECPARRAMLRADIAELDDLGDDERVDAMAAALIDGAVSTPATVDQLAEMLTKASQIARLAERFRSAARDRLAELPDKLQGELYQVGANKVNVATLNTELAWPVLEPLIGQQKLIECVRLGKTKAYDAIKETAPRGQKKGAVEDAELALLAAGAITSSSHFRLDVKRSAKAINERKV